MTQEIGESRDAWGSSVWKKAEEFANNMQHEVKPFYIIYTAKYCPHESKRLGRGAFKQTFRASYDRPPKMLGLLVWFVNPPMGIFQFIPELSFPPDVPVDPKLMGTKTEDFLPSVASKGDDIKVIVS